MIRTWESAPRAYELPNRRTYLISGKRSDGLNFMLTGYPKEDALAKFDTFLDPECECVLGTNCAMHEFKPDGEEA